MPLLYCAVVPVDPRLKIALAGRFAPAGPMRQFVTVLSSLPVATPVEKKRVPPAVVVDIVDEPRRVVRVM